MTGAARHKIVGVCPAARGAVLAETMRAYPPGPWIVVAPDLKAAEQLAEDTAFFVRAGAASAPLETLVFPESIPDSRDMREAFAASGDRLTVLSRLRAMRAAGSTGGRDARHLRDPDVAPSARPGHRAVRGERGRADARGPAAVPGAPGKAARAGLRQRGGLRVAGALRRPGRDHRRLPRDGARALPPRLLRRRDRGHPRVRPGDAALGGPGREDRCRRIAAGAPRGRARPGSRTISTPGPSIAFVEPDGPRGGIPGICRRGLRRARPPSVEVRRGATASRSSTRRARSSPRPPPRLSGTRRAWSTTGECPRRRSSRATASRPRRSRGGPSSRSLRAGSGRVSRSRSPPQRRARKSGSARSSRRTPRRPRSRPPSCGEA